MNLINQLFFAVLISSVTSTLLVIVWWMLRGFFMLVNAKLIYIALRCICIMFLLPIGYIAVLVTYREWFQGQSQIWKLVFARSKQLTGRLQIIAVCWFIACAIMILFFLVNRLRLRRILADNIPETEEGKIQSFRRACARLNIPEGKVTFCINPKAKMPFIVGLIHPQIILPERDYTEDDLEIIFFHELSHQKQGDLKYKVLVFYVMMVHFFNPISYFLFRLVDHWSECMADVSALEASDRITPKQYYTRIADLVPESEHPGSDGALVSTLCKNKNALTRRVDFMVKYRKVKAAGKVMTAMLTAVFMLASVSTAYALGKTIADLHSMVYQNTEERTDMTDVRPEDVVIADDGTEVIYSPIAALDMPGMKVESSIEDDMESYTAGVHYSFNWPCNPNTRHVSGEYTIKAGQKISIVANVTPSDKDYWLGIMDDDGCAWYIRAKGISGKTFTISKTNKYRVFIQNNYTDGTTLQATGSFVYED